MNIKETPIKIKDIKPGMKLWFGNEVINVDQVGESTGEGLGLFVQGWTVAGSHWTRRFQNGEETFYILEISE